MEKLFARVTIAAAIALVLGGCGQQSAKTTQSSSTVKTQKHAKASHKHSKKLASSKSNSAAKKASHSSSTASSELSTSSAVNSQSTQSSASASSSVAVEHVDAKVAGVLLCMYQRPGFIETSNKSGLWYGIMGSKDGGGVPAGYSYISAHGDATSFIAYKVNGDIITYKYIDDTNSKTDAEAPLVTKTISLARLESDYYQTSSQKGEVASYAAKLRAQ